PRREGVKPPQNRPGLQGHLRVWVRIGEKMVGDDRVGGVAIAIDGEEILLSVERCDVVKNVDGATRVGNGGGVVEELLEDVEVGWKEDCLGGRDISLRAAAVGKGGGHRIKKSGGCAPGMAWPIKVRFAHHFVQDDRRQKAAAVGMAGEANLRRVQTVICYRG